MNEEGALIIVSAPSGCGKSTVLHRLMEKRNTLRFSVSATTRKPREGETDGVDYYFVSRKKFSRMIEENAFLEYAEYVGNYYGTPIKKLDEQLKLGFDVYLDIDVQGAFQIKEKRPDTLMIFLMPPSLDELERRLVSRGKDSAETIKKRLAVAEIECSYKDRFDHVVVNDIVERAADEISGIIDSYKKSKFKNEEILL